MRGPRLALAVAALLALHACGDDGASTEPGPDAATAARSGSASSAADAVAGLPPEDRRHVVEDAETTFDVEYSEATVLADREAMEALVEVDTEAGRFVFEGDPGLDLEEGRVLLLPGRALGRVTRITRTDDRTTVETERASLADAIENGTISWDAPLEFDAGSIVEPAAGQARAEDPRMAAIELVHLDGTTRSIPASAVDPLDGSVEWAYERGDQLYQFRLTPGAESVDVEIQATKKRGSRAALVFEANGTIGTLRSVARGEFTDGELERFDLDQKQIVGDIELELAAAGAGIGAIDFELPVVMLKWIVPVGPVPVTVGISTKLIGNITVPNKTSARARSKYAYRGDATLSYREREVDIDASMATFDLDPQPADAAGFIGQPVNVQFGVAFPRVSVSIFDQFLIPYLHIGMVAGSNLSWGPVCKTAYVKLLVEAGYDFRVLGVTFDSARDTLAIKEREARGESCPEQSASTISDLIEGTG